MDREDNRLTNLLIVNNSQHAKIHNNIKLLIRPLLDAGYITYDRSTNTYVLTKCKTVFEQRRQIFENFNNHTNEHPDHIHNNQDEEFKKITKSMIEKYGYITSNTQRWTSEEINFIKNNPNLPRITITTILSSRNKSSIKHKLHRLGYRVRQKKVIPKHYHMIRVSGKNIPKHRHIMSLHLGKTLTIKDVVHHIDSIKTNNDISNLVCFTDDDDYKNNNGLSANSKHKKAEGTFNLCVPSLYNRGIITYSKEQEAYILGDNFITNDENYKPME